MVSRTARRLALASLAALALAPSARARTLGWADDPASRAPAYAASRAICAGLRGTEPPAADRPTAAEAAALDDCSSEALLFGLGVPADPKAARLCAFVEKRVADPQVTDFGFTGDRTLMTLYANGLGIPRDLGLATALACRAGGTPAEVDARVRRLARLKAEGWAGQDFSLCDDAASGAMRSTCADHDQLVARAARARAFAGVSAGWSAADRAAFAPLERAAAAYADAHAQGETRAGGPDRDVAVVEAEEAVERDFAATLADAEAGRIVPADAGASGTPPVVGAGGTPAERAWERYRDAWTAFARQRYPALPPLALSARLARDRAAETAPAPGRG